MSRTSRLSAVLYNVETLWGEVATTFGTRLPVIDGIDPSGLTQEKLRPNRSVQYRNEITPGVNGILGGEFRTRFRLTGHGATGVGALTLSALETLLGIVFGNAAASSATSTTGSGTGTAAAPGVGAANGYAAGSLPRFGAIADARGGGQFAALSGHTTSVMTLLTALDANMSAADVVYNTVMVYPTENPVGTHAITGTRWLFQSANQQYECHGCYPKAVSISGLNPAEEPTIEITWGVSWWRPVATPAFPSATAVQAYAHAPVAAGSFFMNDYGTATRVKETIRAFTLNIQLGIAELRGPGGLNAYQAVVGCTRTQDVVTGEIVIDAEDATASPRLAGKWDANTPQHILYTLSAADSTAMALYLPYCVPDGEKPTQFDMEGLNRVRFKFNAGADVAKSTDLSRSAYRFAIA